MNAIVKSELEQGSLEWHEHRAKFRNASETSYIMSLVIDGYKYPFGTPKDLWEIKTGRKVVDANFAMRRGSALEPMARDKVASVWGKPVNPAVYTRGDYSASLDGVCESDIFEIKCPMKGKDSDMWRDVADHKTVPRHYWYQVQHQLMVTQAKRAFFVVYDGKDNITMCLVEPDQRAFEEIQVAWDRFQVFIDSDTPPETSVVRDDQEWIDAANAFKSLKTVADEAVKKADEAKAALIKLAHETKESGAGVTVTRFVKQGAVDYKKVKELEGVNLDQYRKQSSEEIRVTIEKE